MKDTIVLNFHNSLLRTSDVQLLQNCHWLNDKLIGFWFEYLENEVYQCSTHACLVSPEVTQFIKIGDQDEVSSFVESMDLENKKLIIFPINDSESLDCPGGTHWSLLTYDALTKTFYHTDSLSGCNNTHARHVATKLGMSTAPLQELTSAQQDNFWDCGIYLCCNAELVLEHVLRGSKSLTELPFLQTHDVTNQRERMKSIINTLAQKSILTK